MLEYSGILEYCLTPDLSISADTLHWRRQPLIRSSSPLSQSEGQGQEQSSDQCCKIPAKQRSGGTRLELGEVDEEEKMG
ncbi:hypothetical protein RRG08_010884 [Elysia crispata]|uniref:Uncharacterized protein n=1 Tax=Elysia crispata TaxID=231223 RepID=A0AAE0Z4P6_9GAST|nr:hypothetical protein RRG08_010884 [Elysia crispata]